MKKFRLLFSMLAATAVMFTACQPGAETPEDPNPGQGTETPENPGGETPENPGGETPTPETPAGPTVVEFYADATMGTGELFMGQSTMMSMYLPGHMLYVGNETGSAMLVLLDYDYQDFGCTTYTHLTGHHYPVLGGSVMDGNMPNQSCVVADQGGYSFFEVDGKSYSLVVPETQTSADGYPYGVTVMELVSSMNQDLNQLEFNLPAVDAEGNAVIIRGSYTGPLGYQLQAAKQEVPFNLTEWSFTNFTVDNYNEEYKVLKLVSNSQNGAVTFFFNLNETEGKFEGTFTAVSGSFEQAGMGGDDSSYYDLQDGRVVIEKGANPGEYTLLVSSRAPLVFWSQNLDYVCEGEYTITVTGLPEGL